MWEQVKTIRAAKDNQSSRKQRVREGGHDSLTYKMKQEVRREQGRVVVSSLPVGVWTVCSSVVFPMVLLPLVVFPPLLLFL